MAIPKLSVEVTGKVDSLISGMAKAVNVVEDGSKSISNDLDKIDRSFKILNNTKFTFGENFAKIPKISNDVSKALANTAMVSARSGQALTDLGRIAQDIPFGFIGIQNNLNPLLDSFQRLKAETGSTGGALKALGGQLIGPAGLGFALSAISAGILIYQQYQQKANKATTDAKKNAEDYISTLDSLTQAQLKGAQNAQKELVSLQSLYRVATDTTQSTKARANAVDELQEKYPSYFKNIKDEIILAGGASKAYEGLTQAILATARARAAEELIAKNSSRQLTNEQKSVDLIKERVRLLTEQSRLQTQVQGEQGAAERGDASAGEAAKDLLSVNKQLLENQRTINNIQTDDNKLREQNLELVKSVNTEVKKGADLTGDFGKGTKTVAEGYKQIYSNAKLASNETANIFRGFGGTGVSPVLKINEIVNGTEVALAKLRAVYGFSDGGLRDFITNYGLGVEQILAITEKFNLDIASALNNGAISTFSSLGETIGASLANGTNVLEAAGKSLLSSFGEILISLGKIAIQTGVGIKAITTALKTLNPVVAIGAGVALIALGSLIKGSISKIGNASGGNQSPSPRSGIPQFATGVNNFGGGLALVGERGAELVNLPTGSDVIPNNRTMNMIKGGGSPTVNITAGLGLSGREFVMWFREQEALINRTR